MSNKYLSIRTDRQMVPKSEQSTRHLLIRVHAPSRPANQTRSPIEVAFVLDRSGSMSGQKLTLAKQAVEKALNALSPEDLFTIVAYDDEVFIVNKATLATTANKRAALEELRKIQTGGSTNLAAGWLTGAKELPGKADLSRVLLLTDGLANVGITAPDELAEHAMELRKRGQSLSTFGVGNDFDEGLLQRLSTAGGGNFYYIEDAKQIPDFISSELGEVMARVATRATLEVKASGAEFAMLSAFAGEKNGDDLRIFLGDLVAEQDIEVVLRLTVPSANTDQKIGVNLTDAEGKLNEQDEVSLARVTAQEAEDETPDVYLTKLVAELDLARAHQEAVVLNRAGNFSGAQNIMAATVNRYRGFAPLDVSIASLIDQADLDAGNYGIYLAESTLKNYSWQASNVTHSRTMTGTARVEPTLDRASPSNKPSSSKKARTPKP